MENPRGAPRRRRHGCGPFAPPDALPVALARFTDTTTGDTSLFLREAPAVEKGWGIVVVDPEASRDLIVEVPHPVFDLDTHRQGADLFRGADARVLLLAGTHRCSNRALSPCDGQTDVCEDDGRYHVSDMAHVVAAPALSALRDRGYNLELFPPLDRYFGGVHMVYVDEEGRRIGGSDPRRNGEAQGQ